jgi:hypothetical protein
MFVLFFFFFIEVPGYQPWFDQRFKNAMQIIDLLKYDNLISSQEAQRLADSFEFVKFS